jgi:hypothetical protein
MKNNVVIANSTWIARMVASYVFLSFPICGGHGAGPIGFLLLHLGHDPWKVPGKFGVIAIVAWLSAIVTYRRGISWLIGVIGSMSLCTSLMMFVYQSECRALGIAIGTPTLLIVIWRDCSDGIMYWKRPRQFTLRDMFAVAMLLAVLSGIWFLL